jgi:glycerol-3-phosphate dehydrogenase
MNRAQSLQHLRQRQQPFDMVIIGGGATGLGAAVDAASRGHSVCLVEQSDFGKGTSSRSTKLVHGGVRYLKQGNISLVMEALRERGRLHRNAPHLVHSMAFIIPSYQWWEGPFYGLGMKVYDQLAGELGLEKSRWLSKEEVLQRASTLEQDGLSGGVVYYDGQFDDARLAITLAHTATQLGAVLLNYMGCTGLIKTDGRIQGILVRDIETGEELEVLARSVINATGVHVDTLRRLDERACGDVVAVSQGVHLVLPRDFLPGDAAIMVPKTDDGRVLFAVPWHGRVIVGTTDTPVPTISDEPRALEEERAFLMTHAARYLNRDPQPQDVLSLYAGLRPLVRQGDGKSTAAMSRDHTILISDSGLISITGGKWTTYRKMAADVIHCAEEQGHLIKRRCETETLQLHGWTRAECDHSHLEVYGSDASEILQLMKNSPNLLEPLHPRLEFQCGEVIWHVRHEMARTLEDVLARRTRALLLDARAAIEAAPRVAQLMAAELGWSEEEQRTQVAHFITLAEGYLF